MEPYEEQLLCSYSCGWRSLLPQCDDSLDEALGFLCLGVCGPDGFMLENGFE